MMTVYLVMEAFGEYEDYRERIIGAFLDREKAEKLIAKKKEQNEQDYAQWKKCSNCPAYWYNRLDDLSYCEHLASCRIAIDEDGDEQVDCFEYISYFDSCSYWITELKVTE